MRCLYTVFYNEYTPVNINLLQDFSYTKSTEDIIMLKKEVPIESTIVEPEPKNLLQKIEQQCMKATGVQDGLFWSVYIAVYGYGEYLRNKYNYGKLEVKEKQQVVEYISSVGANKLKTNYRVTRSFCGEIVADLTSLPRMVMSGLIGMSAYYKSDIYIIDIVKNTYLYFLYQEDTNMNSKDTIVLYKNPLHTKKFASNEYFIDIGMTVQSIEEIQ